MYHALDKIIQRKKYNQFNVFKCIFRYIREARVFAFAIWLCVLVCVCLCVRVLTSICLGNNSELFEQANCIYVNELMT